MKKSKTALLVGASVLTIGAAGVGASASAQGDYDRNKGYGGSHWSWNWHWNNERDDEFDAELSAQFAAKYNVDEAEVAALIESVRDDQYNVLNEDRQAALDEALETEEITQEQYDTIIGHFTTIDETYDQIDDASGSERRELWSDIKTEYKELKEYLDDEDISVDLDLKMSYKSHDYDGSHHKR